MRFDVIQARNPLPTKARPHNSTGEGQPKPCLANKPQLQPKPPGFQSNDRLIRSAPLNYGSI